MTAIPIGRQRCGNCNCYRNHQCCPPPPAPWCRVERWQWCADWQPIPGQQAPQQEQQADRGAS